MTPPLTPLDPRCGHSQRESWRTVAACGSQPSMRSNAGTATAQNPSNDRGRAQAAEQEG